MSSVMVKFFAGLRFCAFGFPLPVGLVGKSSLVNALAQQEACIVDSHPGTTADVKTVLLELHDLGPAKLLDTAGLDEEGVLGDKKRRKALNCLKECDVAVVVVDTDNLERARWVQQAVREPLLIELRARGYSPSSYTVTACSASML